MGDLYMGRGLRQNSGLAGDSCPMSDENCQLEQAAYPEMSAFDNLEMALYLIKEALSQMPYMAYLSFMLSLTFLFLFVQPYFFGSSAKKQQVTKKSGKHGSSTTKRQIRVPPTSIKL